MSDLKTLYQHAPHPHKPKNINEAHKAEQAAGGINTRLAVLLTRLVGTMPTAYIFTVLSIIGLFGLLGWLNPFTFLLATWVSQQFLQLVFLPILAVGQGVLGRHSELLAEQQFQTTEKSYHDLEQVMEHLSKQDEELLKHTKILIALQKRATGE